MLEKNRKSYKREEIYESTLNYFGGDELATEVWINKYCLKDSFGNYYEKNPDDMHRRIAKELARIELKYPNPIQEDEIFNTLKNFKRIVPQGSPMSGIGNDFQVVSLSNCFVIGNGGNSDSYGGIFKTDQEIAQLQKRRAGVGTDLSYIRPKGSPVKNSALTSTGIVPFMERHSNTTKEVAQDGRRGALMLTVSIKHPDAEDFIDAKLSAGKVTGANVSVRIDDDFMNAVKNNEDYIQTYPIDINFSFDSSIRAEDMEYNKIYSSSLGFYKKINARKLWKKIVHNAWKSAEPGILFWDTIINESVPDCYADLGFKTVSTNPCGEITLSESDSCRLLALNLYGYVKNPFTNEAYFDWNLFEKDVVISQRYMDDIIDLEIEKIDRILEKIKSDPEDDFIKQYEYNLWERIKNAAVNGRRTGLGITAEGDMLAALGFTYGTDEANKFAEQLHKTLKLEAYRSSTILAKERGTFPIYDFEREIENPFINRIKDEDVEIYNQMQVFGRRNIALLTVAPTGSVSILTQTSSGIEPVYMPVYKRRRKINPNDKEVRIDFVDDEGISWQEYPVFHHKFETWLKVNGYDLKIVKSMSFDQVQEIVKKSPYYKATANDVDWVKKVEMQGMVQKSVDHSISVTVNLPNDVTEEMVGKVYETAHFVGCKGITVYRDGSRSGVLISDSDKKEKEKMEMFGDTHAPKRPKRLKAHVIRFQNNLEKWIAVVGLIDGRPYEIFTGRLENGLANLPISLKECEVVKNIVEVDDVDEDGKPIKIRKKRYDIEYVDSSGEKQTHTGLNHTFNPEYWNYAKLISGILRHGMPMEYVIELIGGLNLNDVYLNTWKNGVVRMLKRYVQDGVKGKGKCPECGGENLEFVEGCLTCKDCGQGRCG
ncbi:MAG: adenosylcobalamin-dependent ribonucleoside-diphosphate reductase [bacterium]